MRCPNGGDLTWLVPTVAVCSCHPRNVWRRNPRTKRLVGVWDASARELADALLDAEHAGSWVSPALQVPVIQ